MYLNNDSSVVIDLKEDVSVKGSGCHVTVSAPKQLFTYTKEMLKNY
jgi:hypothetical protein